MTLTLSILIPTYNNVCTSLVKSLQQQAAALPCLDYEILVADDGSTDKCSVSLNRAINDMPGCRYLEREKNVGRAVIRNYLAQQAKGSWLLFIDSDMVVRNPDFVATYTSILQEDTMDLPGILYGGYTTDYADRKALAYNLRYMIERRNPQNADYRLRQAHPFHDFHTSNFVVRRDIMMRYPLDERFRHYGYEDVLWGKTLQQEGIGILHVDNPLSFEHFETNKAFLDKTEEGLRTLYLFRDELRGYSAVIDYADRMCRIPLVKGLVCNVFPFASLHIKSRLMGIAPSSFLFSVYKLLYFIRLMQ